MDSEIDDLIESCSENTSTGKTSTTYNNVYVENVSVQTSRNDPQLYRRTDQNRWKNMNKGNTLKTKESLRKVLERKRRNWEKREKERKCFQL
jgi:hypothetical protein